MTLISRFAVGGILRNNMGEFMCIFSFPIAFMGINCVEIWAIHRAVNITINNASFHHSNMIIESDSHNVISWCNADEVWRGMEHEFCSKLYSWCSEEMDELASPLFIKERSPIWLSMPWRSKDPKRFRFCCMDVTLKVFKFSFFYIALE